MITISVVVEKDTRPSQTPELAEIVTVTPEMARVFLSQNQSNRNIRGPVVDRYARDMSRGDWSFTGDTIVFSASGAMLNGQHRCLACIAADTSFKTVIVRGVDDPNAVGDMDSGIKRSLSDELRRRGEKNIGDLAASARFGWRYDNGFIRKRVHASNRDIIHWIDENPHIRDSVSRMTRYKDLKIPRSVCSFIHYKVSLSSRSDADEFFRKLNNGTGLEEGDPILALRRFGDRMKASRDKPRGYHYAAVTIKAINAWRDGFEVKVLHWRAVSETFPKIKEEELYF